jgi:hypothetical protein
MYRRSGSCQFAFAVRLETIYGAATASVKRVSGALGCTGDDA